MVLIVYVQFVIQFFSYDIYSVKIDTGKNNLCISYILDCKYETDSFAMELEQNLIPEALH
jgi:hypothetical protein